jgi:hypothetical protein
LPLKQSFAKCKLLFYTKCNYKIGQICEVIFYQDDENNCYIAIVMELFFEEVMIKKNEQIGLLVVIFGIKGYKNA